MKKVILFLVFVICSPHGFSQLEKGKTIINLNGMYSKTYNEYGIYHNHYESLTKTTNIGVGIGGIIKDHFILGVGVDYSKTNKKVLYHEERHWNVNNEDLITVYYGSDEKITQSTSPYIYMSYYIQVTGCLYMQTHLSLKYSSIEDRVKYSSIPMYHFPSLTQPNPNTLISTEGSYSFDYWFVSAHLNFSMVYYLTSYAGLYLELGGMEYAISEWDFDRTLWNINFNPVNWKVGLQFCF